MLATGMDAQTWAVRAIAAVERCASCQACFK